MLRTAHGLRVLGPSDLPDVLALLETDPVRNVFVEYRARLTRLDPRWLGGEAWGFYEDGALRSVCHAAANLVPVLGDDAALAAFAQRASRRGRVCSTIVGPREQVETLWATLGERWGNPREARWDQPHLELSGGPGIAPDPHVRRSEQGDVETLYPACVDMYTEEVGISPEWDGGRDLYRARINQLVGRGWSFARYEAGRVVFKAEIACATPSACQIQGVYVDPSRRGEGLAAAGMAGDGAALPAEMAPVNALLDLAAPALREALLTAFLDRLQRPGPPAGA